MTSPLIAIPREHLESQLGNLIHLSWASKGCCWRLMKIDGDKITCETPKTHRIKIARASDACYTRLHEPIKAVSV